MLTEQEEKNADRRTFGGTIIETGTHSDRLARTRDQAVPKPD